MVRPEVGSDRCTGASGNAGAGTRLRVAGPHDREHWLNGQSEKGGCGQSHESDAPTHEMVLLESSAWTEHLSGVSRVYISDTAIAVSPSAHATREPRVLTVRPCSRSAARSRRMVATLAPSVWARSSTVGEACCSAASVQSRSIRI